MKAENVRKFMLKKYPTKDYFDCPVPKHHWEVIQEYAEQYARIQIEKDRDYWINKISYLEATHPNELVGIRMRYEARPINLD